MLKISSIAKKALSPSVIKIAVPAVALLVVSGFVLGQSSAAFTGYAGQANNTWYAGTVNLSNDHATAQFTPGNIVPGYTETHCVTVTSGSTVATDLTFYATQTVNTDSLGEELLITVKAGSGGTNVGDDCTGFTSDQTVYDGTVSGIGADHGTPQDAIEITDPLTAAGSRQFKITASLPANAPDSIQGGSTALDFNWINHS